MNDQFNRAVALVLKHEGGYVNDPDDPGGATNYGVSLRYLSRLGEIDPDDGYLLGDMDHDGDVDADDIRQMTRDEAVKIYRTQWWDRYGYARISDELLSAKVFDLSVNMGPGRAHRLLQEAANDEYSFGLRVDGILGPKTLQAVNGVNPRIMLVAFQGQAVAYYVSLNRPKYIRGWKRRVWDMGGMA